MKGHLYNDQSNLEFHLVSDRMLSTQQVDSAISFPRPCSHLCLTYSRKQAGVVRTALLCKPLPMQSSVETRGISFLLMESLPTTSHKKTVTVIVWPLPTTN